MTLILKFSMFGWLTILEAKLLLFLESNTLILVSCTALMDVTLMIGAYRSTRAGNISRMLIRFLWFTVLSGIVVLLYV